MGLKSARDQIDVGLLFSVTGPYSAVSRDMLNGALLAIDEVNATPALDFQIRPRAFDPAARLDSYRYACEEMLKHGGISHVIGCYTSSSRKEVIPCFEKYDALLWYPSHYEGFECNSNVVYTGAAPNQHIVPLAASMMEHYGSRACCVGSNYIWAWENNRILRELLIARGGSVLSEKYISVGSHDVDRLIEDIVREKPDFVYNTLIGDSRYAFVRALHELGRRDPAFRPERMPIADCSLSETELIRIGPEASQGLISSSVYFQSIESEVNRGFIRRYRERFGAGAVTSADAEASYIAVWLLAKALQAAGRTDIEAVRGRVLGMEFEAPQGLVRVDPENAHCYLTPRLARAIDDSRFAIFYEEPEMVKPDPYLVWLDQPRRAEERQRPHASLVAGLPASAAHPHLKLVK